MKHILNIGDEIQADDGKEWYIGTLASYEDGVLTLDNPVRLYDDKGGINKTVYTSRQPSMSFKPWQVWVYGAGKFPIFTYHSEDGDLNDSIRR